MRNDLIELIYGLRNDLLNREPSTLSYRESILRAMLLNAKMRCENDMKSNFENVENDEGMIYAYKGNSFKKTVDTK
jgi:hypothetical protein